MMIGPLKIPLIASISFIQKITKQIPQKKHPPPKKKYRDKD